MSYFVTGATGFIGRHLVERLLEREGDIFVLVREGSEDKLERLRAAAGAKADRIKPVTGDISEPSLGLSDEDKAALEGVEHFFHLAAIYDMTASDEERNRRLNVLGTQNAVDLANELGAKHLHYASSIAVAGEHDDIFTEDDFDVGQKLTHPYHQTKFEAEKLVRQQAKVPWRVYRPAIVVGDSRTGEMDKIDGPYYFFKAIQKVRHALPEWFPLVGLEVGRTNIVPVDYVAAAMDHIAHLDGRRRPGLPPRQPEDAEGRRRHEHVRRRRPRAAHGHAGRQADDGHAPEGRAVVRDEAPGAQGHPALGAGRHGRPRRGARLRRR